MKISKVTCIIFASFALFVLLSINNSSNIKQYSLTLLTEKKIDQVQFTQSEEIDCEDDFDCDDDSYCDLDLELCMPFKADGLACSADEECLSATCTNNVCGTGTGTTGGGTTGGGSTTGGGTTGGKIPSTGLLDENPLILYGLLSITAGLLFYKILESRELFAFGHEIQKTLRLNSRRKFETALISQEKSSSDRI